MANTSENENTATTVKPKFIATEYGLTDTQDAWISYSAVGGLITDDEGVMRKMKLDEFCATYNVPSRTLYGWKTSIPDFHLKVRERRTKLFGNSRETNLWNRAYLIAMTTKGPQAIEAIKLLVGNFSGWQPPSQKVEHEVGTSFMDLLAMNRNQKAITQRTIIDATPSDDSQTNT